MAKRHKIGRKKSEKYFTKAATRVHRKNTMSGSGSGYAMRGGIRL